MSDDEEGVAPAVGELAADGVQESLSPAAILLAGYRDAQANREPKDMILHGFGEPVSELHVQFRVLDDYEEVRTTIREALSAKGLSAGQREVRIGIETLLMAACGSYAIVNGARHEIGHPLGLELYDYLFPEDGQARPMTDSQAVVLLFHSNTTLIMTTYAELDMWLKRGGREAEDEVLGN